MPLYSLGDVARKLGVQNHEVLYVTRTRGIDEYARVGGKRVFDERAVQLVRRGLEDIARNRHTPQTA